MDKFLGLTVIGLTTAGVYAVAAGGLVLTYTTTGVFNFAHGAIGMLGAFAFWQLHVEWGLPTWLALLIVLGVLAPLTGVVIESAVMRRLTGTSDATQLVVTVGLLAGALGLGQWIWSPQDSHPVEHFWEGHKISVGGVNVTWHAVAALVVAGAVAAGLRLMLYRSRPGITMRAAVDNPELTSLNGARPDRSAMLAWAIGCSLAALAGIFIAPDQGLQHTFLTLLIVNAYAAAVIGRLRSLPLTFLGAVVLGLADAYGSGYIDLSNEYLAGLRPAIPVIILFAVLLALPQGRLRGHSTTRSREIIGRPSWPGSLLACAGVVLGAAVVAAAVTDADALSISKVFGLGIVALSLVPLVGWAGQISLCQMSFAGVGALVMAHHGAGGNPLILIPVAVLSGLVGALIALPAIRLSGIYLALATGAFAVALDRWIFVLPAFDVGGLHVALFDLGTVPVDRLHVPGVDPSSEKAELIVLSVVFCLLALVVVGLRRSAFGERLLAMKDSAAACAMLGMSPTVAKLAVFSISAAIAGVGGAVYASGLGTVGPDRFSFFESLPVLLLAVVGGLGTPAGALLGALALFAIPTLAASVTWFANPSRVLPGLIGASLGQNPNGIADDLGRRLAPLKSSRVGAAVTVGVLVGLGALRFTDVLPNVWFGILVFVAPFAVARAVAPRDPEARGLLVPTLGEVEWYGVDAPFTHEQVEALDNVIRLDEVLK